MRKIIERILLTAVFALTLQFFHLETLSARDDAGSRAAFTRGGWVGARYVAMGKAAEVVVDDVFAIYWNPAGLTGLKEREKLSPDEIKSRAKKGDIESISEEDLIKFSDEKSSKKAFQLGFSGAMLDLERDAGFGGVAFSLFGGVMGAGAYSIQSKNIESRDEQGNFIKYLNYSASVGYLSYAWSTGVSSLGVSFKGLYEKVGEVGYYGGGLDAGAQVEVIPFFKIGFVIQDIGTGLKPDKRYENIKDEYDFASPVIRLSAAITSRTSDFILALSTVKKLEQEEYELNIGVQYNVVKYIAVYLGLNDKLFTTGMTLNLWNLDVGYAFSYDKIDNGFNNIVSVMLAF